MADVERWIEPYFRDSSLWPVLVVIAAILVALLGTLLLLAVGDRNLAAIAALLALVWMSADATLRQVRSHHRLGLVGGSILTVWALGIVAAFAARQSGLF